MSSLNMIESWLRGFLPSFFFTTTLAELELWQWLILLLAFPIAYTISFFLARFTVFVATRIFIQGIKGFDSRILQPTFRPFQLIILVTLLAILLPFVDLSPGPSITIMTGMELTVIIGFAWLIIRSFEILMNWLAENIVQKGKTTVLTAILLIRRIGKFSIALIAALAFIQHLGYPITTIITALGVGGLAVALAIQRPLQNLLGGLAIILDQPISVGQELKFGTQQGIVEDIGLSSTRIRTLERSVVSVPNLEFSQMQIENLSLRDRIRFTTSFGLRYETSPEQLRFILIEIRKILYSHPKIDKEPARVRLVNFSAQALDVEIVAYVLTSSFSEHLAVKEDILLRVMDLIKEAGTAFATPSQILYPSDQFLNQERRHVAEARVEELRKQHNLPLPEFSDEQISEIDDTLDYPPKGASNVSPENRYS